MMRERGSTEVTIVASRRTGSTIRPGPRTSPRAELKKLTDNVSGYVAAAVARQIRHQLLAADLRSYEDEHGSFSEEELAEARARIAGATETTGGASAA